MAHVSSALEDSRAWEEQSPGSSSEKQGGHLAHLQAQDAKKVREEKKQ